MPYLFDLGPEKSRAAVDEVQSSPIEKPAVDIEDISLPAHRTLLCIHRLLNNLLR